MAPTSTSHSKRPRLSGKDRDRALDRLLAKGRLSGPESEAILAAVLARTADPPGRSFSTWLRTRLAPLSLAVAAAAAVAVVMFVARPRHPRHHERLASKGAAHAATTPFVELGCDGACTVGSTLMFRVGGLTWPAYVAAYAAAPSGHIIWYFPRPGVEALKVAAGDAPEMLPRGVRLGAEHRPGRYRIHLWFTATPLDASAAMALMYGPACTQPSAGEPPRPEAAAPCRVDLPPQLITELVSELAIE